MSQSEFEEFMAAQLAAMAASGLGEDEWVAQCAEVFRNEWMAAMPSVALIEGE